MITPLLSALPIKNIEISEILINKRLNINDSTDIRFTPLHFAAYYNLLDSSQTKKEGEIPLHLACKKGNFEIIKILLNKNLSNINMTKSDEKTGLHLASKTSSLCTQILLKNNANTDVIDNDKNKPSKLALIYG